uniref:TRIO and F-actin binding protein a n=1 Tax=Sinocyclocheilus rhinocerous TaxID=307959 RepID=A0A673G6K4_9TELE
MYMLDEDEEWRKHWFVISDSGLRYYRDSGAEERDEADGEIYLRHCLRVEEFDADKNYGLQLHMRDGPVTLSAMTSRIRRNWIDTLRRRISFRDSLDCSDDNLEGKLHPDNSDISSSSQNAPSRTSPAPHDPGSDVDGPYQDEPHKMTSLLTKRREAGEGRDQELERRLEGRTKWFQEGISDKEGEDPWDKVELKKGVVTPVILTRLQVPDTQTGPDIEKKWADFELLPIGEESSPVGVQNPQTTNEVLQGEVVSLRQQIEALRQVRVAAGVCDPDAPCALKLEQMEKEHRERLQKIHDEHERERREMERDKHRLLQEEAKNAVQAMEALRKAHREEIEKLKAHGGGETTDPSITQQRESLSLQQELDGLSERYSQQCVELSRIQNNTEERNGKIRQKEREMEQLRQENQELQARLTEEISLMRSFITGQRSGVVPLGSYERSTSELEVRL